MVRDQAANRADTEISPRAGAGGVRQTQGEGASQLVPRLTNSPSPFFPSGSPDNPVGHSDRAREDSRAYTVLPGRVCSQSLRRPSAAALEATRPGSCSSEPSQQASFEPGSANDEARRIWATWVAVCAISELAISAVQAVIKRIRDEGGRDEAV